MQKLIVVEQAKALFNQGRDWSIWRWLIEKRRVRKTADTATAALDELEKKVKATWSDELRKAYREAEAKANASTDARARHRYEKAREEAKDVDPQIKAAAEKVREADDVATRARLEAEAIFAEAERRLSGDMTRQGAAKAIDAYEVREKAIRKAEAANRVKEQQKV